MNKISGFILGAILAACPARAQDSKRPEKADLFEAGAGGYK